MFIHEKKLCESQYVIFNIKFRYLNSTACNQDCI